MKVFLLRFYAFERNIFVGYWFLSSRLLLETEVDFKWNTNKSNHRPIITNYRFLPMHTPWRVCVKSLIWDAPNPKIEMPLVSASSWLCAIYWRQAFCREWSCSWCNTVRRCANYTWVINNLIAYKSAPYIRYLTAVLLSVSEITTADHQIISLYIMYVYEGHISHHHTS